MFRKISLRNFRTHVETTAELGSVTLVIGPNNAGKSNLLAGIHHFSKLAARGRPAPQHAGSNQTQAQSDTDWKERRMLRKGDLFTNIHRLAGPGQPMSFSCTWTHQVGTVEYSIDLLENDRMNQNVGCRERICVSTKTGGAKNWESGTDRLSGELALQTKLAGTTLRDSEREIVNEFFRNLASIYFYYFEPSFLKGHVEEKPFDPKRLRIASQLGPEGGNLQKILRLVQEAETRTYNRFQAALRRFEQSFHGLGYDPKRGETLWLFDLGRMPARLDEFSPDLVSDGLLRAAALALLSSMQSPPSLIMVEEIDNGISQRNLGRFLSWLREASGTPNSTPQGYATQFIVTSHSPSVLREFSNDLDDVYYVRLEKRGYKSVVRNLNSSLAAFVDMGTVEGEYEERDGKKIVRIPPQRLTELWYSGTIGGEVEA